MLHTKSFSTFCYSERFEKSGGGSKNSTDMIPSCDLMIASAGQAQDSSVEHYPFDDQMSQSSSLLSHSSTIQNDIKYELPIAMDTST